MKIILLLASYSLNILASGAHQHGVLNLDITKEKNKLLIEFHGSADCFLGFEHRPKKEKHIKVLEQLEESTTELKSLITIDEEFKCQSKRIYFDFTSKEKSKHQDFKISYEAKCEKELTATKLNIDTSKTLKEVKEIKVQYISEKHQESQEIEDHKGIINVK